MNFDLFSDANHAERVRRAFQQPLKEESDHDIKVHFHSDAFPVVYIDRPFEEEFLVGVRDQLLQQKFNKKHNDLYRFLQTEDLTRIVYTRPNDDSVSRLRQLHNDLCSERFVAWIRQVTGIQIVGGRIDMAGQRYQMGDRLLCHDDEIKEDTFVRRIAFIVYLVDKEWSFDDGGRLELFSKARASDHAAADEPGEVVMSIVPKWNSMAFFEVTPTSYHQVSEVLTRRTERISLTGWFYGPPLEKTQTPSPCYDLLPDNNSVVQSLQTLDQQTVEQASADPATKWLNPAYVTRQAKRAIKKRFARDSAVELQQFLQPNFFQEIIKEIGEKRKSAQFCSRQGPPNRRKFESVQTQRLADAFSSNDFRSYLEQITGLKLSSDGSNRPGETRIFAPGSFTMLNDNWMEPEGLDVTLHLTDGAEECCGGNLIYVDGEDTLLTVEPVKNMLSIVYRCDGQVQRFVEYLTADYPGERIDISFTFAVSEDD